MVLLSFPLIIQVYARRDQAASAQRARGLEVDVWHKEEAAAHQKRQEEAATARLAALKTDDLSGYLALLQQNKNGRLQEVLAQTDAVFKQLSAHLAAFDPSKATSKGCADAASNMAGAVEQVQPQQQTEHRDPTDDVLDSSNCWSRLAAAIPVDIPEQPAKLTGGQLREYQMQGLRWMVGLCQKGFNGILADDMGLGKTVQVIAFVCHSVEVLGAQQPFLIVCPASVMSNWAMELQRWAPKLTVVQYKGSADARDDIYKHKVSRRARAKRPFHVLLTTYELLMGAADRPRLRKIPWQALVVDEGHRLKNADCKLSQELRSFTTNSKLLLTGTPLQNNLGELWSLLNFLMPDVFNSRDDFDEWFGAPMQAIRQG
eukprot:gene12418-12554_t